MGEEDLKEKGELLIADEGWINMPTNKDYTNHLTEPVSLDDLLVMLDPSESFEKSGALRYQVFYYNIYFPFVQ